MKRNPLLTPIRCVLVLALAGCTGTPAASDGGRSPVASLPSAAAVTPTPPTAIATPGVDLQALLDARRLGYGAPGGLALVRIGSRTLAATSGTADLAGTPVTAMTRFRIASITKPIVATLVLQAVGRGDLTLDTVVGDLLPGVVRADPPITVRQILNHTSGVFDESNDGDPIKDMALLTDAGLKKEAQDALDRYNAGERVIPSGRLVVALSEAHPRYFAPGSGYHYSNTNYQLAALVVEKLSGKPLADVLRTGVTEPLGLHHMTIAPPDLASPEFRGYGTSVTDGTLVDVTDDLVAFGNGGNGGVISTADDLLTTMQAIVSGRLTTAALAADMRTPAFQFYGLGIATYAFTCGTFYGHEGGVNGTASIAVVSPDGVDGVVIALNLRSAGDPRLPALADDMLCGAKAR